MTRSTAHRARYDWLELHAHALTVACPRCEQPVDEPCRNTITGDELLAPAHPPRITEADKALAAELDRRPKGHP